MASNSFKRCSRIIVIDLQPPMDKLMIENLRTSLLNVVCLFCNLRCTRQVNSALGLIAITNFCECILPLQQLKGQLPRFYSTMSSLSNIFREYDEIVKKEENDCLKEVIGNAISQKKNFEREMASGSNEWHQLEIVIFTAKSIKMFVTKVEEVLKSTDINNINKIQVIRILNATTKGIEIEEDLEGFENEEHDPLTGIIDKLEINNDPFQFDAVFKNWLHNFDSDKEDVHIILPLQNQENFILKCDVFNRILNPMLITQANQLLLNVETHYNIQPAFNQTKSDISKLSPVKLISDAGICESILYGIPIILRPTCNWQIDWIQLEANQQTFFCLCQTLKEKQLVMITKIDRVKPNSLQPHFAIFPSPKGNSLLLKSIAVNEFILPNVDTDFENELIPTQIKSNIDQFFSVMETETLYDVNSYQCGLFKYFLDMLKKTNKKTGQTQKLKLKTSI